jgi:uncharacterized protein
VSARTMFLAAPGELSADPGPAGGLRILGSESVAADPGPWCGWGGPLDYPADQGADDGRSLAFTSAPLAEPAEILGFARVVLRVSADVPQALLAVRLCHVWPDGASTLITRGIRNLAHRDGHEAPQPLVPGQPYDVTVTLNAISYTVPAGHRLRIAVSPAYWPIAWPSPEPATLTVTAGEHSWLELPARRPGVPDPPPPAHFALPEAAPPPDHVLLGAPAEEERTWHRDARRGLTRVVAEAAHFPYVRLAESGLEYRERGRDSYEITDGDPLSALVVCDREISVSRAGWVTRVESRSTLSATRERFLLTNAVDAYEGETRVAARTWSRSIPRDHG